MRFLISMCIFVIAGFGCSSTDDPDQDGSAISSSSIIAVSGEEAPAEADLVIYWSRVSSRQDVEFFITGHGELSNGRFFIEPPAIVPADSVHEGFGIAVGWILAFPKGMAPEEGAYSELDLSVAVGFVNAHSIIYSSPDYIAPEWLSGSGGWWDDFNPAFECALNIAGGDQEFDSFAPIECSEMIMRTGVVAEIMLVDGDWN